MKEREARHAAVHGVTKSQTQLSDSTTMRFIEHFHNRKWYKDLANFELSFWPYLLSSSYCTLFSMAFRTIYALTPSYLSWFITDFFSLPPIHVKPYTQATYTCPYFCLCFLFGRSFCPWSILEFVFPFCMSVLSYFSPLSAGSCKES